MQVLANIGVEGSQVREAVSELINSAPTPVPYAPMGAQQPGGRPSQAPALEEFGTDLKLASQDALDPVIGREREIDRVEQILLAPHEEQPPAYRRARRGQDRRRRGACPAHRRWSGARRVA